MHALAIIVYNGSKCMRSQSMHAVAAHWLQSQNSRACHGRTNTPPAARAYSATRIRIPGKSDLDIDMRSRPAQAQEAALAVMADGWNHDPCNCSECVRCNCRECVRSCGQCGRRRPERPPLHAVGTEGTQSHALAAIAGDCSECVQLQQTRTGATKACNCSQCIRLPPMNAIAANACHCVQCALLRPAQ